MRVIITGGTGLVGRALAADLARDRHEVILLSRVRRPVAGLPEGVHVEVWDACTRAGWAALADGADAIVNLAGENIGGGRWTPERKRRILNSRVDAGHAVVDATEAARHKPRVVVQASAVGYYGPHGDETVDESTPLGSDFLSQVCREWEASTARVEALGVRRAITRSGLVLSTLGGALPRLLLPFRLFVGGPLGSGRQWFPWIHIADEVAGIRFLVERDDAAGPFNLAAPEPVTNASFARAVGRALHRPAIVPMPGFALRLALGEMACSLLQGQRAVPRRLQQIGFAFRFPQVEPALLDLLQHAES